MKTLRLLSLATALTAALALGACNKAGGSAAAGGLSDDGYAMGNANAKVTVVEYGSLTCPHCAHWEEDIYPAFKAKYVDTGKVRYVFRETLIHPQEDAAGALLARCVPADKYFATVQAIMRAQPQIFSGDTRGALLNVAKSEGMTEDQFTKCLSNTDALKGVEARQQKVEEMKIDSTPTFIINGQKQDNTKDMTLDRLSAAIDPLLPKT